MAEHFPTDSASFVPCVEAGLKKTDSAKHINHRSTIMQPFRLPSLTGSILWAEGNGCSL